MVLNSTHIGTLSDTVKAMYLINQTQNCNIPLQDINHCFKNKKIIVKGNKKDILFEHFFDNFFYSVNDNKLHIAIFYNLGSQNINSTIISINNIKITSIKNITLFNNSETEHSLFLSNHNIESDINPFLKATRVKIKK